MPSVQRSVVQALASPHSAAVSHGMQVGSGVSWPQMPSVQRSVVHALPSPQSAGVTHGMHVGSATACSQIPATQVSLEQAFASSHSAAVVHGTQVGSGATLVQVPSLQASVVQAFWSLQSTGGFVQAAAPRRAGSQTFWVQASPSSHRTTGVAFGEAAPMPVVSVSREARHAHPRESPPHRTARAIRRRPSARQPGSAAPSWLRELMSSLANTLRRW